MARLHAFLGLAAACAALSAAPGVRAATFDVVGRADGKVTLLDAAAVEKVGDGQVRRAWSVNVQKDLVSGGTAQPGYVRTLNEYDCTNWKVRWRSFSVYSRFGEMMLQKDNPDTAWTPIEGNLEAAASARIVCDGRRSVSVYTASSIGQLVVSLMQAWDATAPAPPLQPVAPPPPKPPAKHKAKS